MQRSPRPDVEIGDHILTPYGVARVEDIDYERDGLVTTHGSWAFEEIEAVPAPDTANLERVEAWLGLAARVVPKAHVRSAHAMCPCDCEHCYRTIQFRVSREVRMDQPTLVSERRIGSFHYRNNEICRCVEKKCACL